MGGRPPRVFLWRPLRALSAFAQRKRIIEFWLNRLGAASASARRGGFSNGEENLDGNNDGIVVLERDRGEPGNLGT